MARYVIKNDETKSINKALKKFSRVEIPDYVQRMRGSFTITNYRKYIFRNEIDIEFNGEINAVYGHLNTAEWHNSTIYFRNGASKIKINRFIKKRLFQEVKDQAAYFGITLRYHEDIKKIKWV